MRVRAKLIVSALSALALALAAACQFTGAPLPALGAFRLESIGGSPMPVTLTGAVVVESESLTLESGGDAAIETLTHNLTEGSPDAKQISRRIGTWSWKADRLTVTVHGRTMRLRVEDGGDRLRTEETSTTGPGLDVYREYLYRREP